MTQNQRDFIARMGPIAQAGWEKYSVLASLTIAQAICESGWGASGLTRRSNNFFGIKAGKSWTGCVYSCRTKECYDGKNYTTITDAFRAYGSWAESVEDHGKFLSGLRRYKAVIGETDYKKACIAIHKAGYATGPDYAKTLISLIETYNLTKWDANADADCLKETGKSVEELAREVIAGQWGNGDARRNRLTQTGYSYADVQRRVNEILRKAG